MDFLTLLIAIALLHLWGSGGSFQREEWFHYLCKKITPRFEYRPLGLLFSIGLPCVLLLLLQSIIDSFLFGLAALLINVSVLLFALGRGDFDENIQRYLSAWNRDDLADAKRYAADLGQIEESVNDKNTLDDGAMDAVVLHTQFRSSVVSAGFERWFAVLFWFLVLGPVGALGYRLTIIRSHSELLEIADRERLLQILHYSNWLPARLLAFTFSLTGNFVNGFSRFWASLWVDKKITEFIGGAALAAISGSGGEESDSDNFSNEFDRQHILSCGREQILALQSLLSRSLLCWIAVVALVEVFL